MKDILIIEDNDEINQLLADVLTNTCLYRVTQAFSGTEGLNYIKNKNFQLVLLDLSLPGMKGQEILHIIVENSNTPVIVITATRDKMTKVDILTKGADDFIAKPFDLDEVLARVTAVLRRAGQKTGGANNRLLTVKDIALDPIRHKVTINGRELNLTGVEYRILLLLMSYPEKVFSKANIFESVWEEPYFGDDAVVNTHMSNLRSKLAKTGTEPAYIETVWGIGYKMADNEL